MRCKSVVMFLENINSWTFKCHRTPQERARKCARPGPQRAEVRKSGTVFADRLILTAGGKSSTFGLRASARAFAVLAQPDRPASVVCTVMGASSLQHQVPQAAFEYWKIRACRRE